VSAAAVRRRAVCARVCVDVPLLVAASPLMVALNFLVSNRPKGQGHTMSKFQTTLATFCEELRATFPELATLIGRTATVVTPASFWRSWQGHLAILAERDGAALHSERRGILVPPLVLSEALWGEVSANTQMAIWRYLRTLLLEALMEGGFEEATMTEERSRLVIGILTEERLESLAAASSAETEGEGEEGDATAAPAMDGSEGKAMMEEMFAGMSGLMDRLRGLLGAAAAADGSGGGVEMPPFPEIPERLKNGRIARLAQEMAKQFKPEEFGIDPALLTAAGDNVEEVLRRLAEMYQRDPTLLIAGAKRMADRIRRQVMGGSLKQEDLIAEAREFVELFKEHPLFKEAIAKFQEMVGEGGLAEMFGAMGGAGAGAPSERLRAVQERLRKKLAARQAKK
jgi:hypothetical protein